MTTKTIYDPRKTHYTVPHPHFPDKVICQSRGTGLGFTTTSDGVHIAAVASVTIFDGAAFDWACYVGAAPYGLSEAEMLGVAAAKGAKLPAKTAAFLFPEIAKHVRYRD